MSTSINKVGKGFFWSVRNEEVVRKTLFTLECTLIDGSFTGKVSEEDFTRLSGGLTATVKGFIEDDFMSFVKTYPISFTASSGGLTVNHSRPGHQVTYAGNFVVEEALWRGEWEIIVREERIRNTEQFTQFIMSGFWEMSLE